MIKFTAPRNRQYRSARYARRYGGHAILGAQCYKRNPARAKLRKRKAKFKPALFAPSRDATESHTSERRKFKPRSATARTVRGNKLTTLKRSADAYVACDTKSRQIAVVKFKELLNFKVRRILRILKFTALKFHSLR